MAYESLRRSREKALRRPRDTSSDGLQPLSTPQLPLEKRPVESHGVTEAISGELLGELLGQGARRRICDLIDMRLHFFPGLGFRFVFTVL